MENTGHDTVCGAIILDSPVENSALKYEGKTNTLSEHQIENNNNKLRPYVTRQPTIWEMLKEILQQCASGEYNDIDTQHGCRRISSKLQALEESIGRMKTGAEQSTAFKDLLTDLGNCIPLSTQLSLQSYRHHCPSPLASAQILHVKQYWWENKQSPWNQAAGLEVLLCHFMTKAFIEWMQSWLNI